MRKEGKTSSKQELLLRIYFSSWIGNLVLMSLSHCRTDWLKNKNVNFSTCWMNVNLKLEGQFTIQRGVPQTSCQHLPNLLISFHRRLQLGKTWIKFSKLELLPAFRKHFLFTYSKFISLKFALQSKIKEIKKQQKGKTFLYLDKSKSKPCMHCTMFLEFALLLNYLNLRGTKRRELPQ